MDCKSECCVDYVHERCQFFPSTTEKGFCGIAAYEECEHKCESHPEDYCLPGFETDALADNSLVI